MGFYCIAFSIQLVIQRYTGFPLNAPLVFGDRQVNVPPLSFYTNTREERPMERKVYLIHFISVILG